MSPLFTGIARGIAGYGFGLTNRGTGLKYTEFHNRLSPAPFDFTPYLENGGKITIMTVYGSDGVTAPNWTAGGDGGNSELKYRTMPIDGFVTAYGTGNSVDINVTLDAPYFASTNGHFTVSGGNGANSAPSPGDSGGTFPAGNITTIGELFGGQFTVSAGSPGYRGNSPGGPNQYGGRGGGGGAGGLNVTGGTTPIPTDPAATSGGNGGNAPGTPHPDWPGRTGAQGGAGGGGGYGSGGGGGGSGNELSGTPGPMGAGGSGQGGMTLFVISNQNMDMFE